jgi:hypothetical protein
MKVDVISTGNRAPQSLIQLKNGKICHADIGNPRIKIWDLTTRKADKALDGYYSRRVIQLHDGRLCCPVFRLGIVVLNMSTLVPDFILKSDKNDVNDDCVIQLRDGCLFSGSRENCLVWDIRTKKRVNVCSGHTDWVTSAVQLNEGDDRVCSGSWDGSLLLWVKGCTSWTKDGSKMSVPGARVTCVQALRRECICAGYTDGMLRVWSVSSRTCVRSVVAAAGAQTWITSLVQLQDDRLCSSSEGNVIKVWNSELTDADDATYAVDADIEVDATSCTLLEGHTNTVNTVIQLADGRICSASCDYTIRFWNLPPI